EISAKKGIGVEELMEKVLLEADMLDLKANPNRKATGTIIESSLDKGRGYVSTVLVSNGTLKIGDVVIAGVSWGRVKAMFNERNQRIDLAKPAEPAIILGLNGAPTAGDAFHVLDTEQEAREVANKREQLQREQSLRTTKTLGLDDISHRIALGEFHELNIIVKGDTDGSIEALSDSFIKLSTEKVLVNVISKAVGAISENDVMLASASSAIIVGFQVRPSADARKAAEREGVEINTYSIIYDAIDDIKSTMEGMLDKVKKEIATGEVQVKQVFKISKVGTVAGGLVTEGKVHAKDKARVVRDGIVIHTANISALKRYKDDVKEVVAGMECGLSLVNFNDIQEGDIIETFTEIEVDQKL
ncbi:MAG: translation initiation factor IF-2, partial [Prevotella sp.]